MNSLSWLLYLAEVSESVKNLSGFLAAMIGLFGILPLILAWTAAFHKDFSKIGASVVTGLYVILMIVLMAGATLLPSSKTIYMIAASEAGETIVTNPETIEMMTDLKNIIKNRLKEELGVKND